jgi:phospholipid transport system substrate-binding protein
MKKIFTFFLFSIIFISNTNISLSIEPDVFIQSTVNRAASTLSGNLSKDDRIEELKQIAIDTVDINGIGLYSLGSHRKNINKNQLSDYKTLFKEYFLKSFSSRLAEYSNPEIEVISKNIINKNYTIVLSKLVRTENRPEVKIEWRVYTKNPDNLLIRDLIIEGLSLARTQKEEFNSIINSNEGDIKALLKSLNNFSSQ